MGGCKTYVYQLHGNKQKLFITHKKIKVNLTPLTFGGILHM